MNLPGWLVIPLTLLLWLAGWVLAIAAIMVVGGLVGAIAEWWF